MQAATPVRRIVLLAVALVLAIAAFAFAAPASADAASYGTPLVTTRTIKYNKTLVASVGTQAKKSQACCCYAYAYAQTIVTGKKHDWTDYDTYGGSKGETGASAKAVAGYKYYSLNTQQGILSRLYTSINQGHPCVLWVKNSSGGSHWVCVIGYEGVTDPSNLKTSQFRIIDPASKWASTEPAKLSRYPLYYASSSEKLNVRVSTKTIATTTATTNNAVRISGATPITSATALPAAAMQTADVAGPYVLVPKCATSSAVDLAANKTENKTNVLLWKFAGDPSQQFYLLKNSDGTFSIQSALTYGTSNLAFLHTVDQYSINGRNVHLYANRTNLNSHWYVERNSDGTYSFRNANSDLYLDVAGANSADGTNVRTWVWDASGANNAKKYNLVVPHPTSIEIDKTNASIKVGDTLQLAATYYYNNSLSNNYFWQSADESIAKVSATGVVTGVSPGKTTIYAASNDVALVADCTVTVTAAPSSATWTRLAGQGRYDTMAAIVGEGFATSSWAVVATGQNFPDALAASALAGYRNCPVILTKSNELSAQAASELKRLGVKNVYIMGGEAAVSKATENAIKKLGVTNVVRVAGDNRRDTSVKAMNIVKGQCNTVIIATGKGYADTLSIGPWSYAKKAPIVLTKSDGTLDDAAVKAIKAAGYTKYLIVGGTGVVSDKVKTQLSGLAFRNRLGGADRYETSKLVVQYELGQGLTLKTPAVATGANYPDALAGAALCGKNKSVMALVKDGKLSGVDILAKYSSLIQHGYVFGGAGAVSDQLASTVAKQTSMTFVK